MELHVGTLDRYVFTMTITKTNPRFSLVLETPAPEPEEIVRHFQTRLMFETDVADLMFDLDKNNPAIAVIDTRSPKSFLECHIPGAINLPKIDEETTADLSKDKLYVVYCWGIACNGAIKGAMRLAALGFKAKELMGGIEYWRNEGGKVEGTLGDAAPLYWRKGE